MTIMGGFRAMVDEDEDRRPLPERPYRPHGRALLIPRTAMRVALAMFRAAGLKESGLFLYGTRGEAADVVTSVRAPRQTMSRGNFEVTGMAMSEMCRDLPDESRLLAQVHTHPGSGVEHSRYDDEVMASRRALSLVVPFYGCQDALWPESLGVHEWQINYWHLLEPDVARRRVRLSPDADVDVKDFR